MYLPKRKWKDMQLPLPYWKGDLNGERCRDVISGVKSRPEQKISAKRSGVKHQKVPKGERRKKDHKS
jgi:hypothetical protein